MVAPPLVEPYLEQGRALVDRLEMAGFGVEAAFWLYREESDSWRLVIATDLVHDIGPTKTYGRVRDLIPEGSAISLLDISVVKPGDPLAQAVRKATRAGTDDPIRLRGTALDGQYISDALVYRLKGRAPARKTQA